MRIFKRKLKAIDLKNYEFKVDNMILPYNNNIADRRFKVIKYHINFQRGGSGSLYEDLYDYIECEEYGKLYINNKMQEGKRVLISAYCFRMLFENKTLNINKGDIVGFNCKPM